jgi:hypothetical protein
MSPSAPAGDAVVELRKPNLFGWSCLMVLWGKIPARGYLDGEFTAVKTSCAACGWKKAKKF